MSETRKDEPHDLYDDISVIFNSLTSAFTGDGPGPVPDGKGPISEIVIIVVELSRLVLQGGLRYWIKVLQINFSYFPEMSAYVNDMQRGDPGAHEKFLERMQSWVRDIVTLIGREAREFQVEFDLLIADILKAHEGEAEEPARRVRAKD